MMRGLLLLLWSSLRLLKEVSALDLVAVLAGGELLEVRLVLGRHEGVRHPARRRKIISACRCKRYEPRPSEFFLSSI